jgi:hypothetical protein
MDNPLSKMPGTMKRADRYQNVAGEYYDLPKPPPRHSCGSTFSAPQKCTGCGRRAN